MAFAAVLSLTNILATLNIFTQSEWDELDSLFSALQQLDDECYRGINRSEILELEAKIREAAWKLEDAIESYQISLGVDEKGVEQEIHSFFNTANKLRKQYEKVLQNSCVAVSAAEEDRVRVIHDVLANSTTVGLSDLSQEIITGLLDDRTKLCRGFLIWGMAGIGKTHLARDIYHHPFTVLHFDLRLWVNIGSKHRDIENIFIDILAQIESKPRYLFMRRNEDELKSLLRNSLLGRKYLVVFDDIWSPSVLRGLIDALPYCKIILTARIYMAETLWYDIQDCPMPFLSNEESWNLLRKRVFAEKSFPTQLEIAGRKIAEICEGLPLLILTVADILRGLDRTEECWNKVAGKKTTTFQDAYDRIYKVLVLSYDYLPQQCKACFLYMGVFPQSHVIPASKLIRLWIVEGLFVDDKVLEVLVFNSLVIVCKHSSSFTIKSCKLHCTYWYVCVTEARKSKLFHVLNKLSDVSSERPRRLSVQNNILFGIKEVYDSVAATTSLTRSLLFTGKDHQYPVNICFNTMLLLKVLYALAIRFYEFPNEVVNLLQLHYLALTHNGELPSSISKLQRLHFLILSRHHNIILVQRELTTNLPKEIWDLQELEYLQIMGSKLPNPSSGKMLTKLSTLYVKTNSCTEGVLRGTPSLSKLGIEIELQPEGGNENSLRCLEHIWLLKKLESLKCVVVNPRLSSQFVAPYWPWSVKKLSLKGLGYPWMYMSAIGSLPNLEILKLKCIAFRGPKWKMKDGEFLSLKYLLLEDIDLVHWTMERHLPNLEQLVVRHCYKLKKIPYIPTLKYLEVDECSPSIVESVQQKKDNYSASRCKVVISYSWNL